VLVAYVLYWGFMKNDFSYNDDLYEKVEELLQSFESYQIPLNNEEYFSEDANTLPISKYIHKVRALMADCTNVFNTIIKCKIRK